MRARKLLILGGSGFVGHYLLPRLGKAGHTVTVLTRNRAQHRELGLIPGVHLCNGDVHDAGVLAEHLSGQDAVINLVGILNESGDDSFQKVHVELTEKLITACQRAGVARLLQISALKAGQGLSEYLKSRGRTEQRIKSSQLDWTLLQSSVMFGPGDGLVSRFGGLLRLTPVLPLPRPHARMAPVYVDDIARAVVRCLDDTATRQKTMELYGPDILSLIEIVRMIASAMGKRRWIIGMPDGLGKLQASVAGLMPGKPFTRDNFLSLRTDSVGTRDSLRELGIEPHSLSVMLPQMVSHQSRAQRYDRMRSHLGEQRT
ncbi:MAG: complex I NDUFA9 subunit family protein [Rhodanobacteraceae bacterium]